MILICRFPYRQKLCIMSCLVRHTDEENCPIKHTNLLASICIWQWGNIIWSKWSASVPTYYMMPLEYCDVVALWRVMLCVSVMTERYNSGGITLCVCAALTKQTNENANFFRSCILYYPIIILGIIACAPPCLFAMANTTSIICSSFGGCSGSLSLYLSISFSLPLSNRPGKPNHWMELNHGQACKY